MKKKNMGKKVVSKKKSKFRRVVPKSFKTKLIKNKSKFSKKDLGKNKLTSPSKAASNNLTKSNKKRIILLGSLVSLLLLGIILYFSFFYSYNCETSSCFREMVSSCYRSSFTSPGLLSLKSEILGPSLNSCKVKVELIENDLDILNGIEMVCNIPFGLKILPQDRIDFCTGKLREEIQELILSELYKTVGQNLEEISYFFKD